MVPRGGHGCANDFDDGFLVGDKQESGWVPSELMLSVDVMVFGDALPILIGVFLFYELDQCGDPRMNYMHVFIWNVQFDELYVCLLDKS
jgi:hypothetical protein